MKIFSICISVFFCLNSFAQNTECKPSQIVITANKFNLEYNDSNQLVKITDRNKSVFKLSYNETGELVKSENLDSDGELYDTYLYKTDRVENYDEDGLYISYIYEMLDGKPVKIIKKYEEDNEEEVFAELVWENGNVIEQTEYEKEKKTIYKFQYDDKINALSVLRFYVDFNDLLNYAEIFSKNNMVKVTTSSKVINLKIEYNEQGCVSKTERNHYGIMKEFIY